jgi:nucleolar complex protein 3
MKKLKELRQMLSYADVKCSFILKKLIVVSLCEIYKDILPSYKIRPWTEKEKEQNVSHFFPTFFQIIKIFIFICFFI